MQDGLVSLEELKLDYPDLTVAILEELAQSLSLPIVKKRLEIPGKPTKKLVTFMKWDDVIKLEETFADYIDVEQYIPEEEQDFEEENYVGADESDFEIADNTIISSNKLSRELKTDSRTLDRLARRLKLPLKYYKFSKGAPGVGYTSEESELLKREIEKRRKKIADNSVCSLVQVRKERSIGSQTLDRHLGKLGIAPKEYWFVKVRGFGITKEEVARLDAYLDSFEIKPAPKNVKSVNSWAKEMKTSARLIIELADGVGISPKQYLFHGVKGGGLSEEEIQQIKDAYKDFDQSHLNPISIKRFTRENHIEPKALIELAAGVGIEPKEYNFRTKRGMGFTQAEIETISNTYSPFSR